MYFLNFPQGESGYDCFCSNVRTRSKTCVLGSRINQCAVCESSKESQQPTNIQTAVTILAFTTN